MCVEMHNVNKEVNGIIGGRPIAYWLFTYVRDRKYYEFSGNSSVIPWDKINSTIIEDDPLTWESAAFSPLEYKKDTEDDVWTGYVVFEGGVDWISRSSDVDMKFKWKEGAGTPPQKEHSLEFNVYSV